MATLADHLAIDNAPPSTRRATLFREAPLDRLARWTLGAAWALSPQRIGGLPALGRLWLREMLAPDRALPDPEQALDNPYGLAGIVHDLSLPALLAAYRCGLYPLAHIAPLKWWSPPQRTVLFFPETHIGKNLRRELRRGRYKVTFDRDFDAVIAACARNRRLTWITPRVMHVFAQAFDAGHVHSFEVWNENGELAGGGYGLATGGAFVTESQFSREKNTSKLGFAVLNWHLARWGFAFNDGKLPTPALHDVGFREIPRTDFLSRLAQAGGMPGKSGRWQVEADTAAVAAWQPGS
ncbi:MAG: leucyl/phenylalanyl-tRNA--protein transferase [Pseudolabrys sp.]